MFPLNLKLKDTVRYYKICITNYHNVLKIHCSGWICLQLGTKNNFHGVSVHHCYFWCTEENSSFVWLIFYTEFYTDLVTFKSHFKHFITKHWIGSPTTGKKNEMSSILKSFQFWLKFAVKTGVEKEKKKTLPILSQWNSIWKFIRVIPISKNLFYGK